MANIIALFHRLIKDPWDHHTALQEEVDIRARVWAASPWMCSLSSIFVSWGSVSQGHGAHISFLAVVFGKNLEPLYHSHLYTQIYHDTACLSPIIHEIS